jgi:hypothetical protein
VQLKLGGFNGGNTYRFILSGTAAMILHFELRTNKDSISIPFVNKDSISIPFANII